MTHRILVMPFAAIHSAYVAKAERKGRSRDEVTQILCWLTGHTPDSLAAAITGGQDVATFFAAAPALNPARDQVTGVICGVRIETITDPLMREIRILDKLVDDLAKGRPIDRILRQPR